MQPKVLCKLRRGKALAAFPAFVDTFNWLVDFCANLKGEGEESDATEHGIRIDRTVSDNPVIRGGGSSGASIPLTENFDAIVGIRFAEGEIQIKTRPFVSDGKNLASIGDATDWKTAITTTPHSEV